MMLMDRVQRGQGHNQLERKREQLIAAAAASAE